MRLVRSIAAGLRRAFGRRSRDLSAPGLHLGPVKTPAEIERAEGRILQLPQVDLPLIHRFAPGVYLRTVVMPAGSVIIGHEHTTEHFNIVLSGRAEVLFDGRVETVKAGDIFTSGAGVRKVLHVLETCTWATIHPTEETDLEKIESKLIRKSDTWQAHARLSGKEQQCLG